MRVTAHLVIFLILMAALLAPAAWSDDWPIKVYLCPAAAEAPVLDGSFEEPAWQAAPLVKDGFTSNKRFLELAPDQTSFQVTYDQQKVYLAVTCYERRMDNVSRVPVGRDDGVIFSTESVEVFFDSEYTKTRGDELQMVGNIAGSLWDPEGHGAQVAAHATDEFWALEWSIPWSGLGLTQIAPGQALGFNLSRNRHLQGREYTCWSQVDHAFHDSPHYGTLILSPTAESVAKLRSELRRGERHGLLELYGEPGLVSEAYLLLAGSALEPAAQALAEAREAAGGSPGPAASKRLAEAQQQLEALGSKLNAPEALTNEQLAETEQSLHLLVTGLQGMLWDARLEELLRQI